MQGKWMILAIGVMLPVALAGVGCASHGSGPQDPVAKRFEGSQAGRGGSGSAVDLTERVTQLAEKAATLQQQNQQLTEENARLSKQATALEAQLKQTQTELTEANALLIEMLGELNNWKSDILGFRTEMRVAAKAQLEALLKILEVLGAEAPAAGLVPAAPEPNQPTSSAIGAIDLSKGPTP
jgi:DNA repair exonuclease SbcCD ATPase subunit